MNQLDSIFSSLRLGLSPAVLNGRAVLSTLREMKALRMVLFAPPPPPELPAPPPELMAVIDTTSTIPPALADIVHRDLKPDNIDKPTRVRRVATTGGGDRTSPYRLLWLRVFIRAAYDYALWRDATDIRLRKWAEDARKWLFDPSDLEFSLESLCYLFCLPITKLRKYARELTKDDVKKLEFKERQGRDLLQVALLGERHE
jgi:hypothetical protein